VTLNKLNLSKRVNFPQAIIFNQTFILAIKLQFLFIFILPYFYYCMSLYIYYPKVSYNLLNFFISVFINFPILISIHARQIQQMMS